MWHVYLEPLVRFGSAGYRLYVGRDRGNEGIDLLHSPTIHHLEPYSMFDPKESLLDDGGLHGENVRGFLQAMSDAAWEIGIKPKQIEDNSNELKAVRYHLEDMRGLVMKMIGPPVFTTAS